ncbi:MAG: sugar phosphate isomerase/epimerase [Planctomycetes bacterium]|nr:sugar phosphate isomerase/epimerase [Planctomycetota bacterium]
MALASAAATGGMAGTLFDVERSPAIEPIERQGGSKYKLTLAGYSYRRLLTGKNPECSLEDFVRECARFGLEGTEPTSYYFPHPVTNTYLCRLKATAFRLGLAVSSTAVGNDFCLPPGEERERQIDQVKQWIDHAQVLGAPVIRIFSGSQRKEQTAEEARRLAVEAIEQCCEYAGRRGIFLGLENHGGLTGSADQMLTIVQDVKSPWFGVWMDTGNFHSADVYAELEQIAPYTLHVQVKVVISEQGRGKTPADFSRIRKILDNAGYRGWICLEYEESEDPRIACPKYIAQLREAFASS